MSTVDAIAEAASVSRKTVFTSVGGKLEALKLARDWAIVGDDEPVPVMERPEVQRARKEPDARVILHSYAGMVRRTGARVAALNLVIEAAEGLDAGARALAEEGRRQRLTGMRDLAGELARRKRAAGWNDGRRSGRRRVAVQRRTRLPPARDRAGLDAGPLPGVAGRLAARPADTSRLHPIPLSADILHNGCKIAAEAGSRIDWSASVDDDVPALRTSRRRIGLPHVARTCPPRP